MDNVYNLEKGEIKTKMFFVLMKNVPEPWKILDAYGESNQKKTLESVFSS